MQVEDAIRNRRSIRRFRQEPIPDNMLYTLADLARLYPSAGNRQPIRTAIVTRDPLRSAVFETLQWAMYLPDYAPGMDQRPTAYLILLSEKKNCMFDLGAAAMAVMLAAEAYGLASCCLQSAEPETIGRLLGGSLQINTALVIALGYGAQTSNPVPADDDLRYRLLDDGSIAVPKLDLSKTLIYSDLFCENLK